MKMVRGRADARWLPSRHRFALFRLYAALRLRLAKPEPRDSLMLIVDRDQSAYEHHGLSLWIVLTVTCYVAGTLPGRWPLPLALLAALPLAVVAVVAVVILGGLLLGSGERAGVAFMLVLAVASGVVARHASWSRFVAWHFFAVVALNAVAAAIVFVLRGPIARMERELLSEP